jgi:hypothetical protein
MDGWIARRCTLFERKMQYTQRSAKEVPEGRRTGQTGPKTKKTGHPTMPGFRI